VTADRIVLCQVIVESIKSQLPNLENQLFGRYILTQYVLLYIVREILDKDILSFELLTKPEVFVRRKDDRDRFRGIISKIVSDIITDLNVELKELGPDFDYRDKLRDSNWVSSTRKTLVATHTKLISRKYIGPFKEDWHAEGNGKDVTL
jgi:hypothetical protein